MTGAHDDRTTRDFRRALSLRLDEVLGSAANRVEWLKIDSGSRLAAEGPGQQRCTGDHDPRAWGRSSESAQYSAGY
jgi:hypothetical protein